MSGPAAHPDVTWPLSTPSSSGLARCARETLVTSPPWAVHCCPRNNCAPPVAQTKRETATAAVAARTATRAHRLSRQQCSCCDSNTRLRTTAKTAQNQPKQKTTFQTFWVFWLTISERLAKAFPRPGLCSPLYSLCFLTALQPRPKTVAASGQSLSQHSCRDSDTRARGSQSQRRIATDNVPNFLGFL
ncbi:hypothetical protein TYRP_018743, partial [Tyrophagus putrescentiae]